MTDEKPCCEPVPCPSFEDVTVTVERLRPVAYEVAAALRNMATSTYETAEAVRIWGRLTTDATAGPAGNAWAGTPEDVALHLDKLGLLAPEADDAGQAGE